MRRQKNNYLSNNELLPQIWLSKLSYCWTAFPDISHPQLSLNSIAELSPEHFGEECRITVITEDCPHIPDSIRETKRGLALPFRPFTIFEAELIEGWIEVREIARSFWKGSLEEGCFSKDHGKLTNKLGRQMMLLVDRIATKPNFAGYSYLDELKGTAIDQLCRYGLKFDQRKGSNPFAYLSTLVMNAFRRALTIEAKQQSIRDDLLQEAGALPSMKRQLAA